MQQPELKVKRLKTLTDLDDVYRVIHLVADMQREVFNNTETVSIHEHIDKDAPRRSYIELFVSDSLLREYFNCNEASDDRFEIWNDNTSGAVATQATLEYALLMWFRHDASRNINIAWDKLKG